MKHIYQQTFGPRLDTSRDWMLIQCSGELLPGTFPDLSIQSRKRLENSWEIIETHLANCHDALILDLVLPSSSYIIIFSTSAIHSDPFRSIIWLQLNLTMLSPLEQQWLAWSKTMDGSQIWDSYGFHGSEGSNHSSLAFPSVTWPIVELNPWHFGGSELGPNSPRWWVVEPPITEKYELVSWDD